jgi:hypothetical protein
MVLGRNVGKAGNCGGGAIDWVTLAHSGIVPSQNPAASFQQLLKFPMEIDVGVLVVASKQGEAEVGFSLPRRIRRGVLQCEQKGQQKEKREHFLAKLAF